MKEIIRQVLPLWGIEDDKLLQVYSSAWEVNGSCILKIYDDLEQMEGTIKRSP